MTSGKEPLTGAVVGCDRTRGRLGRHLAAEPAGVAELAHTLKGSARGVGAWPVARAAEAVEVASAADLAPALAALAAAAGETRATIAEILAAA